MIMFERWFKADLDNPSKVELDSPLFTGDRNGHIIGFICYRNGEHISCEEKTVIGYIAKPTGEVVTRDGVTSSAGDPYIVPQAVDLSDAGEIQIAIKVDDATVGTIRAQVIYTGDT